MFQTFGRNLSRFTIPSYYSQEKSLKIVHTRDNEKFNNNKL